MSSAQQFKGTGYGGAVSDLASISRVGKLTSATFQSFQHDGPENPTVMGGSNNPSLSGGQKIGDGPAQEGKHYCVLNEVRPCF